MTFGGRNVVNVTIRGDKKHLDKELRGAKQGIDKFGDSTKRSFSNTASFIKGAFVVGAGLAIGKFVKDSIGAFSELNESTNAVEVTFGDAAEGIKALGENAADSLGLAKSEFNTLAVRFSSFVETIAAEKDGDVVATMDMVKNAGLITDPPHEVPFLKTFFEKALSILVAQGKGALRIPVPALPVNADATDIGEALDEALMTDEPSAPE